MGHGKETPRQKMIGLMYLFLTCMLALNVSKEVLDSFVLVSDSLERTINNYKSNNEKVYNEFQNQLTINERKVKPWKDKADVVKKIADELYNELEQDKIGLITLAEPESKALVDGKVVPKLLASKDNTNYGGEYFNLKPHGKELRLKVEEFRETLLKIIPDDEISLKETIKQSLNTDETESEKEKGVMRSWESQNFEHIPLIADLVMLTKIQTDVKNIETDVITYLFKQISAGDFKFNALSATVIPNSNYVMRGGEYNATVFLAAFDSMQDPEILVGSYKKLGIENYEMVGSYETLKVEKGRGIYNKIASSIGDRKWGGLIRIKRPDGTTSSYPFETEYQVAEPSLVISPTKMNVFYYGIDNPVAISIPGIPEDKLRPSIPNGATINKVASGYEVKPSIRGGTVTVMVSAEIDGKQKSMGSMVFRVKTIPEPKAKVMGSSSGTIERAILMNALGVSAELEDFVFDLKFRITKYTVTTTVGGMTKEINKKGNEFDKEIKDLIKGLKTGSKLIIEDIEAVGPDGVAKTLSPIVFKIK
jgi:gliding motility-associated protein GldM